MFYLDLIGPRRVPQYHKHVPKRYARGYVLVINFHGNIYTAILPEAS
jgi:hypothetical protein